jgi:bidirectional [NiFe] hydrogenase diaphorase subunit
MMVKETSLCGLGQSAPNPVLSTLRFFRNEYEVLLQPVETYMGEPGVEVNFEK